jgi:hypothetical protein
MQQLRRALHRWRERPHEQHQVFRRRDHPPCIVGNRHQSSVGIPRQRDHRHDSGRFSTDRSTLDAAGQGCFHYRYQRPDSYSVDVPAKVYFPLGNSSIFGLGELVWHRNSQQKKQQNHLQASGGFHFEWDNAPLDRGNGIRTGFGPYMPMQNYLIRERRYTADKSKLACVVDLDHPDLPHATRREHSRHARHLSA